MKKIFQNRHSRIFLLLILLQVFSATSTVQAKTLVIDSEKQYQYAKKSISSGEFDIAILELKRFIHFFPEDEKVPNAYYLVGLCYLNDKKFGKARKTLNHVYGAYKELDIAGEALFLIGESYFREGNQEKASLYFEKIIQEYDQKELKNRAVFRLGWNDMKEDRWQSASENFKKIDKESPLHKPAQELALKSLEGEDLSYKNPVTAGVMAAVLPGMGHVYSERYKDGVVAFLLNALFVWAAWESFDQDHDVLGGILAFVEAGWYTGNIYSAVNSAHKYNRKAGQDFLKKLPDPLKVKVSTRNKKPFVGLALEFDF